MTEKSIDSDGADVSPDACFPSPSGPRPEGWTNERWLAFQRLHEGWTYAAVARAAGRSKGTISGWVRQWRTTYGEQIFVAGRRPGLTAAAQAEGQRLGGAATAVRYASRRMGLADNLGQLAADYMQLARAAVDLMLSNPDRIAALTPRDVLSLVRAADIAFHRADVLADIGKEASRAGARCAASFDLSDLEGELEDDDIQETLRAADEVVRRYGALVHGRHPNGVEAAQSPRGEWGSRDGGW